MNGDVILPIDLANAYGRAFRSPCLGAARLTCPPLAAICAAQWEPNDGWIAKTTTSGGWQGSSAMQVMLVLGLEHARPKLDNGALRSCTRIGLQDDMTFIGSAAKLDGACDELEVTLASAGHRPRSYKCSVWTPGFGQFDD